MTEVFEVDLSDVDEDSVEHAYRNLSAMVCTLLEHEGVTEAEIVSAIGDVLLDLSHPGTHGRMQ
jgi:hypothetical protein